MDTPKTTTEAGTVAELAKKAQLQPHTVKITRGDENAADVILVPNASGGYDFIGTKDELDSYRLHPRERVGTASVITLESFCAHVVRNRGDHSVVFANFNDPNNPQLIGVHDYHHAGPSDTADLARGLKHRTVYKFPLSDEWRAWTQVSQNALAQAAFAEWLEQRALDVLDPSSDAAKSKRIQEFVEVSGKLATRQELLALSRGLAVHVESKISETRNLQNGSGKLVFEEVHKDEGGNVFTIPGGFVIGIPVFSPGAETDEAGALKVSRYAIPVKLRYRPSNGRVNWFLAMHRPDLILKDALAGALKVVREQTGLPVFQGTPEQ